MLPLPAGRDASSDVGARVYARHCPERTLLYQLIQEYYPALKAHLAARGTFLPGYVEQEFDEYLSVDAWSTVFCGCAAIPVMPSTWWPSAANAAAFARAVVPGAWPIARRC